MESEWHAIDLGELGEFRNGINFSRDEKGGDGDTALRLINVKDLYTDTPFINLLSLDKITLRTNKNLDRYKVKSGDIFFARSSVKRDGVGVVSMAKHADEGALHCGFVIRFRLVRDDVDRVFLSYLLRSPDYRARITNLSGGAAITNISQDSLRGLSVRLPPTRQQERVAAILSAYDDLIENNLRRIKILEEMAQNLYREWFVKFRFPGQSQVRMVDSPLGEIPEGWEVNALGDLVSTQYGYTESAQDKPIGPRYLRGKDINKTTYIDWDSVPYCPIKDGQRPKYKLYKGDILIIRMADPGKVGIVEKEVEAVFASYLVRLSRKTDRIGAYYLFHLLIGERYQDYITGASTGTTRKSASAGVLTGIDVLVPPESLLKDFESKVQTIRQLLNNLIERNNNLRQTRDLLLPKLISGELDVSTLPIDTGQEAA
uniref:Type I restriction enzyme, S subunit n=1 Tax=Candidatus Kentrum sp. LPFa TaxID=2126335 RepID=A0A450W328_9GAMM|nr:MAG: type I restriction enzyme, S subunit [Candidatus Kentron sp. LPFa]VFK27652.1 MAG: type I restriction enzyme, S subunit [Candidatus Kentron sp. LPFa]